MRCTRKINSHRLTFGAWVLIGLATVTAALAQSSGGDFELVRSTVDGGGGRSSGGDFILEGTIGQPDASVTVASGGDFELRGGFWFGRDATPRADALFTDSFEN